MAMAEESSEEVGTAFADVLLRMSPISHCIRCCYISLFCPPQCHPSGADPDGSLLLVVVSLD